ncbi:DNA polymerase subunit gamma-1, mitochondrial [Teleopsis dalmanni]|uniref:DNA polymerase subunit gamma-1, mitochondrial n=1 Tax=Teleopsis dalmanni TaxID=139649 RepID=UPI0018CD11EF|nr:DNA polymerase subunit gamma-1, mitochondrial [Teleopsis dalmanni]
MHIIRSYSKKLNREIYPTSRIKIFKKAKAVTKIVPKSKPLEVGINATPNSPSDSFENASNTKPKAKNVNNSSEYFENMVKVQMISKNLHEQIFKQAQRQPHLDKATERLYLSEFKRHGIEIENTERLEDVQIKLPPLRGNNIEDHFYTIAEEQVAPYKSLLMPLVQCAELPKRPSQWVFREGWTVYDNNTGIGTSIEYPTENALVFDVEVCVQESGAPVLATAVGTKHWYSWVSPRLASAEEDNLELEKDTYHNYTLDELIPLGKVSPKIIVGHNVSYDRARIREQYLLDDVGTRFVDTMSLHVCVSGITSYQRAMMKSKKELPTEDIEWRAQSSLNNLVEVHKLYCGGETLTKEPRNIFVEGSINDVRESFQALVDYCASDVEATHRILKVLFPLFAERFPHPATFAGMLEIGCAYLPVNANWLRYIRESDLTYDDLIIESKYHLTRRADESCRFMHDGQYRNHLWLWDEDWSTQELKMKHSKSGAKTKSLDHTPVVASESVSENSKDLPKEEHDLQEKFKYLYDMKQLLPARRPILPGYPAWYRKLCKKPPFMQASNAEYEEEWHPGATEISTGMQIAPKLLSLCWEGYPLHYLREQGWGFLVPFRKSHDLTDNADNVNCRIPIEALSERCPVVELDHMGASENESDYAFDNLNNELDINLSKRDFYKKIKKDRTGGQYKGTGVWCNKVLENCCYFLKLPHKNGSSFRVGNPLSKDFLNKFSENVLSSGDTENDSASRVIEIARMMSYWRNNRDRIIGQMVTWLPKDHLPERLKSTVNDNTYYGAICPQIVVCGTLTRRAMEPTWLTASNSQRERVGSELRAMVQAPPTYKIIGADVDSQELWIASVLGDAYACGVHGATPLGWMTLSGSKKNGTDMHSVTAKAVAISRDHAKVINYARIYGAGQNFTEGLLKQFNPTFSATEAKSKAMKMFAITKGKRLYKIREEHLDSYEDKNYSSYEAMKIAVSCNRPLAEMFHKSAFVGGTESAMFNRLESIALSTYPVTPFLGCRLSRSLESSSGNESRFLPTRINWVVQSGAVDFLHLMLVSMRWLMGPHVRFCLSFHDEIRYLVKDEMSYKAALAMHITNLLTRSFCSSRIGLKDLPMSVAFFSSVEIDTALRKESTMDCKTPSNPYGLQIGYEIPPGESLNIYESIEKAGGNDLTQWEWIK